MSGAMVKLSDLSDPVAFLTGARVPLITTDGRRAECAGDLLFVWSPITASYGSCAVARMGCEPWLSMDLSEPDVTRWCDRQIAMSLGLPNPEHAVLSYGNEWCFWILADECPRFIGDLRTGLASVVRDIPCTDANIPLARAALLRALFGVSNA